MRRVLLTLSVLCAAGAAAAESFDLADDPHVFWNAQATAEPSFAESLVWEQVQEANSIASYRSFLQAFPNGAYSAEAAARLNVLEGGPAPTADVAEPSPTAAAPATRPAARPDQEPEPEPQPGPTLRLVTPLNENCDVCPRILRIPGGETVLGSDQSAAERPRTPQTIATFYLSAGEITVGEMRRYEEATGNFTRRSCFVWTETGRLRSRDGAYWGAPGFDVTNDHPAACINWDDAQGYVDWLNAEDPEGGWRLPSEAEFEYAARAGKDTAYPWPGGAEALCARANGAGAESRFRHRNQACDDGVELPVPAGEFPINPFGLSHMIGNLWEWTEDCWNGSHRGATADGAARTTGTCSSRVLRGGSWDDPPENLRSAYRVGIPKNRRQANVGFRVARDAR